MTITDTVLYLKLCWSRALSHINFPLSIIERVMLLMVLLKTFNVGNEYIVLSIVICVFFVIVGFFIGHWDLKYGIFEKENSLSYKYINEIQTLLKKVEKEDKKDGRNQKN